MGVHFFTEDDPPPSQQAFGGISFSKEPTSLPPALCKGPGLHALAFSLCSVHVQLCHLLPASPYPVLPGSVPMTLLREHSKMTGQDIPFPSLHYHLWRNQQCPSLPAALDHPIILLV
jgi:hypothetical protein